LADKIEQAEISLSQNGRIGAAYGMNPSDRKKGEDAPLAKVTKDR